MARKLKDFKTAIVGEQLLGSQGHKFSYLIGFKLKIFIPWHRQIETRLPQNETRLHESSMSSTNTFEEAN